jgi:crotonobetaine/carnitine-CoA ligase
MEKAAQISIIEVLANYVREQPDRPLLTIVDERRTYSCGEIWDLSRRTAAAMRDAGVIAGDRVGIMVSNRLEHVVTWFGASIIGAIPSAYNTAWNGAILDGTLTLVKPRLIVVEESLASVLSGSVDRCGLDCAVVGVGADESYASSGLTEFWAWLDRSGLTEESEPVGYPDPAAPGMIVFTSGTTGGSKGCAWPHNMIVHHARVFADIMSYGPDDNVYNCLPLFHGSGMVTGVLASLYARSHCYLGTRFSASTFWGEMCAYQISKTLMVGMMASALWSRPPSEEEDQHPVRTAMVIPPPAGLHDKLEDRFQMKIVQAYGLSDIGLVAGTPADEVNGESVGKLLPGWEVRLVDDFDEVVPTGEVGEMACRPLWPSISTSGYWNDLEATLHARKNLWFHSGDYLKQDDDGWFYFVDRKKDALRRRGENVSSSEVEMILLTCPGVAGAAVFAIPSELSEDDIMASLILEPDTSLAAVAEFADANLPYFMVPRYYDARSEFPLTPTNKVMKTVLRREGVTSTTWDRATAVNKVPTS